MADTGWTIANRERARLRQTSRLFFDHIQLDLFEADRRAGFTGKMEEWKTQANLERICKEIGSTPYTIKQLRKAGWKI